VIITDEIVMAFADDELDAAARAAVEAAMREDPSIAKRIAAHRALRQRVELAYANELAEPLAERLLSAAHGPGTVGSRIVNLKDVRDAQSRTSPASRASRSWWQPAGAIAASVIVGFGLGYSGQNRSPLVRSADGSVVADGQLAQALAHQLSAESSGTSSVSIGVSFLSKSGDYCRSFVLSGGAVSPQGLACHRGQDWQILALTQFTQSNAAPAAFRTAGSEMSPVILKSVEEQIAGEPLDQSAEAAARSKDWKH
jgi:hypothetical protein